MVSPLVTTSGFTCDFYKYAAFYLNERQILRVVSKYIFIGYLASCEFSTCAGMASSLRVRLSYAFDWVVVV